MPKPHFVDCSGWRGVGAHAVERVRQRLARDPLAPRRLLVLVPTEAAAHLFRAQVEDALLARGPGALVLPATRTPPAFFRETARAFELPCRLVDPLVREALVESAFQRAESEGTVPPFAARPSLAARVLEFYDELLARAGMAPGDEGERDALARFERRALEELDAPDDEGAEKMAAQTRFLARSMELYRRSLEELGFTDAPALRREILDAGGALPYDEVLALGPETLTPADLDFFSRAPGPASVTVLVPASNGDAEGPVLLVPRDDQLVHVSRDREESVMDAARLLKHLHEASGLPPMHRVAIVVPRPLPYLYVVKKVFREAGIPFELQDSFPLATEPYLAAVDLVLELVGSDAHRTAALALLRSPFFRFEGVGPREVASFDELTLRLRETGGPRRWRRLLERKSRPEAQPSLPGMESRDASRRALPALRAVVEATRDLSPLAEENPLSHKIEVLSEFLSRRLLDVGEVDEGEEERSRDRRARAALDAILHRLVAAAAHLGDPPIGFARFRERLRRAVSSHTFAERSGRGGVQVVDARSAGFGDFDLVLLLGLDDSEWPARAERNIFYPLWLLREFGWPSDTELLDKERARFRSLLTLARRGLALFRHQLEDEAPTVPSPFLEDVAKRLAIGEGGRIETMGGDRLAEIVLSRREALRRGLVAPAEPFGKARAGIVASPPPPPDPVSPTSFELFLRCPFKYYARHLLRIEEEDEVDETLSPLERGRILHDILQEAFERWDQGGEEPRAVEPASYDEALSLFRSVALERIPGEHRRVEMARLFGSRGEPGTIEWLLRREMTLPAPKRRLVEASFQSALRLARGPSGESPWFVRLKGRVDRADVDADGALHVYDYKSGRAPAPAVTLQVPLYAMCLGQELAAPIREAAYLSFRDRKLTSRTSYQRASERLIDTYRQIQEGRFPPRPYQAHLCWSCGYVGVCRKEIDASESSSGGGEERRR